MSGWDDCDRSEERAAAQSDELHRLRTINTDLVRTHNQMNLAYARLEGVNNDLQDQVFAKIDEVIALRAQVAALRQQADALAAQAAIGAWVQEHAAEAEPWVEVHPDPTDNLTRYPSCQAFVAAALAAGSLSEPKEGR